MRPKSILILTLGSHGDVQPYVALGLGLRGAGHRVTLCAPLFFEPFIRGHGLDYAPMDNGFVDLLNALEGRQALERMGGPLGVLKVLVTLVPKVGPLQERVQRDAWAAAQAVAPDLIVFHPKLGGATDIAETLAIPAVLAPLFPQCVPTDAFAAVGLPEWPLGRLYRRGSYRLVQYLGKRIGGGPIRRWREANGLGAAPPAMGPFTDARGRPRPVMHGFSPLLCPRPDDWPADAAVVGDWPLAAAVDYQPPDDLAAFLAAGPPPVYVGFGSMAGRHPEAKARVVLAALELAGVRGLVARGWGGLDPVDLPSTVHAVDQVPHDWLFPRVAVVVHHGGAGTTHAGLRAGRPTVICPFFGDQPFWGRRVQQLGVGPAPIRQGRLTAARLSAAIEQASSDAGMARRAAALGERLRAEDGVAAAVAFLEAVIRPGS
jgi:sterol 3beta-glucosyltransferase